MIVCAAIKIQVEDLDHETIVPALRHGHVFKLLEDLNYAPKTKYKILEQGFITHDNKFLNRKEAFKYVKDIGQCTATQRYYWEDRNQTELYSEDLY